MSLARIVFVPVVAFVLVGLSACGLYNRVNDGPLLNPQTGPGTPWKCNPPSSTACDDGTHTCCPASAPVCIPDGCKQNPYDGNKDWIGKARSVPREKAVQ